ncbi:hypothetical protein VIGAN_03049700, partial [Vigna angularis var. angularis]
FPLYTFSGLSPSQFLFSCLPYELAKQTLKLQEKNIILSSSGLFIEHGCFPLNAFFQSLVIYLLFVELGSKLLLSSCSSFFLFFLSAVIQQQLKFPEA